jgi:hypothetical membrane protein
VRAAVRFGRSDTSSVSACEQEDHAVSDSSPISRIIDRPTGDTESKESSALLIGTAAFIVGGLIALIVFWGREVPISGRGSLGDFAALGGAITAACAFVFGCVLRRRARRREAELTGEKLLRDRVLRWYDIAALTLAHAIIALLGWVALAAIMTESFPGAVVYSTAAAALGGVAIALTAFVSYLSAVNLTPMLLSIILAMFLALGVIASMLSATDPLWWQKNLSTLGISDDFSALAFNLTLIIAGVMVTTIAHYATSFLPDETTREVRGRRFVRYALALIGILLACVGIFPVDEFPQMHNISAVGMIIVFVTMTVTLRRQLPSMPRVFVLLGYVYVAAIVVLAIFFITGYYSLTAVELVVAVLVFSWVILFLRNTGAVSTKPAAVARP